MKSIETIFSIVVAIIIVIAFIRKLSQLAGGEGRGFSLEDLINRGLGQESEEGKSKFLDSDNVKIYDDNGNELNFEDNYAEDNSIIYDENGNIVSSNLPPEPVYEEEKLIKKKHVVEEKISEDEVECDDFIRRNGASAIVVREILDKPLALR